MKRYKLKTNILPITLSFTVGIIVSIMIRLNASLGKAVGVIEGSFITHVVGTIFALILASYSINKTFLNQIKTTPKYLMISGFFGVIIVIMTNIIVPIIGVTLSLALFITANLIFGTISDHFGLWNIPKFKITAQRIIGLILTIAGLTILLRS